MKCLNFYKKQILKKREKQMAIKDIRTIDTGIIPYDVRVNSMIEKAKAKGRIYAIANPPIVIPKK